ncbi:ATP-binding protein [Massilia horti]|uniref:histidine kinase n=1 Tax=Massilia horti TaxID=2562153 RepID=A0A4Y9SZX2_9BURK|nr:ATP-binding protein [Massilia horti]TFW32341.1 ATPase [Massilia horti]
MDNASDFNEPRSAARLGELEALVLAANRTKELEPALQRLEEDIRKRDAAEAELTRRNNELTELNARLSMAQEQLIQSEKLASIGQLAAGVAHEINNPIGYVFSNFETLGTYIARLLSMLEAYQQAEASIGERAVLEKVSALRDELDIDFLIEDIPLMMQESREGITRVRKIVQDLKDFSRADATLEWQWANLHAGIDSTLNIVANEVKYKADVVKEYGDIPEIECQPSHINQVIMNIVVNGAHAITGERGVITIRTGCEGEHVWVEISDTGAGIPKDILSRIFDPFFTTKPIGSGTGLGLSLSYGIIQKHNGQIEAQSEPGQGTTFRITLPIRQQGGAGEGQQ